MTICPVNVGEDKEDHFFGNIFPNFGESFLLWIIHYFYYYLGIFFFIKKCDYGITYLLRDHKHINDIMIMKEISK